MNLRAPKEYVLKTTVDEKTYRLFARIAETNRRSLSNQLRLEVERLVNGKGNK